MIILRTHVFGERERTLVTRLEGVRSHSVAIAIDESRGSIDVSPFQKISVTRESCTQLGLYCPRDFTWRNGDYVFYLARKQYPAERYFWMLEPDVEHSFRSDSALFEHFDKQTDADLLIPYFCASTTGWWWHQTARTRFTGVKRALFCIVRLSAPAIDLCLRERKKGRFSVRERLFWPNDEVFIATEIVHAGLSAADLNDFGSPAYTPDTLSFDKPIDGTDEVFRQLPNLIYHPVLYGAAYKKRIERIHRAETTGNDWKYIRRKLQRLLSFSDLPSRGVQSQAKLKALLSEVGGTPKRPE